MIERTPDLSVCNISASLKPRSVSISSWLSSRSALPFFVTLLWPLFSTSAAHCEAASCSAPDAGTPSAAGAGVSF